jgi:hypothetical protein
MVFTPAGIFSKLQTIRTAKGDPFLRSRGGTLRTLKTQVEED